jgi:hypothetical protein
MFVFTRIGEGVGTIIIAGLESLVMGALLSEEASSVAVFMHTFFEVW